MRTAFISVLALQRACSEVVLTSRVCGMGRSVADFRNGLEETSAEAKKKPR